MIPDEKNVEIIFQGVRNALLASFGDMIETRRRQGSSWQASFIKWNHRESLDKFLDTDRKKSVFFYVSTFSFKEAKRTFLIPWVIGLCTGISTWGGGHHSKLSFTVSRLLLIDLYVVQKEVNFPKIGKMVNVFQKSWHISKIYFFLGAPPGKLISFLFPPWSTDQN